MDLSETHSFGSPHLLVHLVRVTYTVVDLPTSKTKVKYEGYGIAASAGSNAGDINAEVDILLFLRQPIPTHSTITSLTRLKLVLTKLSFSRMSSNNNSRDSTITQTQSKPQVKQAQRSQNSQGNK